MEDMKNYIDKRIDEKVAVIERRLKNSFQAMKKDNEFIKEKLALIENNSKEDFEKVSKEILRLDEEDASFKEKTASLDSVVIKNNEILVELAKINQRIDNLTKDFGDATKLFVKDAVSTKQKVEEIKKSMNSKLEEKDVNKLKDEWFNGNLALINEINLAKEQVRDVEKKVISDVKKLNSEVKEKEEKLSKIDNQIVYLKGRVKSNGNNEVKEKKSIFSRIKLKKKVSEEKEVKEEKKSIFSKIVDGLSD